MKPYCLECKKPIPDDGEVICDACDKHIVAEQDAFHAPQATTPTVRAAAAQFAAENGYTEGGPHTPAVAGGYLAGHAAAVATTPPAAPAAVEAGGAREAELAVAALIRYTDGLRAWQTNTLTPAQEEWWGCAIGATQGIGQAIASLAALSPAVRGTLEGIALRLTPTAATPAAVVPTEAVVYAVPCGCDKHGDHLGCDSMCQKYGGCTHPLGVEITTTIDPAAVVPVGGAETVEYSVECQRHGEVDWHEIRGGRFGNLKDALRRMEAVSKA